MHRSLAKGQGLDIWDQDSIQQLSRTSLSHEVATCPELIPELRGVILAVPRELYLLENSPLL